MRFTYKYILVSIVLLSAVSCSNSPTLYLVGDSTMADKNPKRMPEKGWGQMLSQFFNEDITIENHAKNGRSSRSFIYEGRWDSIMSKLSKGDFVVVQFAHNDEVITKTGRYCVPEEYRYNLIKFIQEAQGKGAEPVLCTAVQRRNFDSTGTLVETHGDYPEVTRQLAIEYNLTLIDLQQKSDSIIRTLGIEGSKALFMHVKPGQYPAYPKGKVDNTHFVEYGATLIADEFVKELRKQRHKLVNYLKE